jgi:protein required for attachment to host cells
MLPDASRSCVVVADRARARLFVVDPPPPNRSLPKLREVEALTDSEGALKGGAVFSNTRSGTNRSPSGAEFEYDDHRERHRDEVERRFARRIADAISSWVRERSTTRLVLAAEPRLLGLLREEMLARDLNGAELEDLDENLSGKTPEQIANALARRGLMPFARNREIAIR